MAKHPIIRHPQTGQELPKELFANSRQLWWTYNDQDRHDAIRFIREDVHTAEAANAKKEPDDQFLLEIIMNRYDLRPSEALAFLADLALGAETRALARSLKTRGISNLEVEE